MFLIGQSKLDNAGYHVHRESGVSMLYMWTVINLKTYDSHVQVNMLNSMRTEKSSL